MTQQNDVIIYILKLFIINLYAYFGFMKISNIKKYVKKNVMLMLIFDLIISTISAYIANYIDFLLSIVFLFVSYSIMLGIIYKKKLGHSLIIGIISYGICMSSFVISTMLSYIPYHLGIKNNYINLIIISIIQFTLIYAFFKIKRFKNGFTFLQHKRLNNDFIDVVVINVSSVIILIYCLIGDIFGNRSENVTKNLIVSFMVITITMIITIQRTLTMHYKQKLMKDTLADYERDIAEKDKEIERLKNEKFNISKITHEFYNRQKSLEMAIRSKVADEATLKENLNMETSEELSALDRIQDLTKEYSEKLKEMKSLPTLPLTEIPEIDDMFKYMQTECDKNNIEFRLKIVGNIFYLINNIIPKNKLETMIGDHIRDAIIAINSSKTTNKEIFVILGVKDKKYELCIYDTGVEFEIDTLLKLGLEQVTTHKDAGGSGIGFLTTFETLNETKASLIIKELSHSEGNHYTKAVIIRFDNKHQYKICSYRAEKIKEKNNKNRKVIIENISVD